MELSIINHKLMGDWIAVRVGTTLVEDIESAAGDTVLIDLDDIGSHVGGTGHREALATDGHQVGEGHAGAVHRKTGELPGGDNHPG